jgi:hypothetical protein
MQTDDSTKVFYTPIQASQRSRSSFWPAFDKFWFLISQRFPSNSPRETKFDYPCYSTKLIPITYNIKSCDLHLI